LIAEEQIDVITLFPARFSLKSGPFDNSAFTPPSPPISRSEFKEIPILLKREKVWVVLPMDYVSFFRAEKTVPTVFP
jgi:hypothetical protein